MGLLRFVGNGFREVWRGGAAYWAWVAALWVAIVVGTLAYGRQIREGLITSGMSDQVSWGFYIANFTFLEAVAAASVMLIIPAYIFHRDDLKPMVLLSQGIAVAAVVAAMLFVAVDLGRPERMWHMLPGWGRLNLPGSLMAWDVLTLNVYLVISATIPAYMLYRRYRGHEPSLRVCYPGIFLSIAWSVAILTVTAFLFSSNVGRPYWNTAIMGPRFLAAAFTGGTALIVLTLTIVGRVTRFSVPARIVGLLGVILATSIQFHLFLQAVEIFTDFYNQAGHSISARHLYIGVNGHRTLVPWIWTATALTLVAGAILTIHPLRRRPLLMGIACVLAVVGVWIDKAVGLIVAGFVPTPVGELFDYAPTRSELLVSLGIWAVGLLVFTLLAKVAIPIELGDLRCPGTAPEPAGPSL